MDDNLARSHMVPWTLCAVLLSTGCGGHSVTFDHLNGATRIEIFDMNNRQLATVTDRAKIDSVLSILAAHTTGWSERLSSGSIPDVALRFFRGDVHVGTVGIGPNYLTDDPSRSFTSTAVTAAEIAHLCSLVGIPPPTVPA